MKATVKDELTIPPQTRYLVPIELGKVERHVCKPNVNFDQEDLLSFLSLEMIKVWMRPC